MKTIKNKENFKWAAMLFVMLVCALFGVMDGSAMAAGDLSQTMDTPTGAATGIAGDGGSGTHVTGGAGIDTAQANAPGLLLSQLDQDIVQILPYKTPLDTIMRSLPSNKRITNSIEVKWASVDIKPFTDTVKTAYAGSTTDQSFELEVNNNQIFAKSQTIAVVGIYGYNDAGVQGSAGGAYKDYLKLYVADKTSAGKLVVYAINGGTIAGTFNKYCPAIAAGTTLIRLGRAAKEKDIKTESYTAFPQTETNYCQSFKCQVEVTEWYKRHDKSIAWDKEDIERSAIVEYKMEIETSILYGSKGKLLIGDSYVYLCNGILHYFEKSFEYGTGTWDHAKLVDLSKETFIGNAGSEKRFFLMGADLMAEISKIDYQKTKDISVDTKVVWGITWSEIRTNFGTFYCMHYPMLDEMGLSGEGLIIDPEYLFKYVFEEENKKTLDLKSNGESNVDASVTTEVFCAALKYPQCHMRVQLTT